MSKVAIPLGLAESVDWLHSLFFALPVVVDDRDAWTASQAEVARFRELVERVGLPWWMVEMLALRACGEVHWFRVSRSQLRFLVHRFAERCECEDLLDDCFSKKIKSS